MKIRNIRLVKLVLQPMRLINTAAIITPHRAKLMPRTRSDTRPNKGWIMEEEKLEQSNRSPAAPREKPSFCDKSGSRGSIKPA